MIYLHTGLPGAGKTLFTLAHFKPLAEAENRQVYYFGIPNLMVPGWIELSQDEAMKWYDLPPGSIIIIDEAQNLFRPRSASSKVPDHVARLETHRHAGHDLCLITQHPGLIDLNVRKLVGTHRHVVRTFGAKFSMVHEWGQCKDNCDKSRKDSIKKQFRYPKEVFSWYKSAEVHTHKARIPKGIIFLVFVPAIVIAAIYYAYRGVTVGSVERAKAAISSTSGHPVDGAGNPAFNAPARPRAMTRTEYLESFHPRVEGLPHTAARYDEITRPVTAPHPAACLTMRGDCRCYTNQGTIVPVGRDLCLSIVERGFFVDWDTTGRGTGDPARQTDSPVLGAGRMQGMSASEAGQLVAVR